jgi:hypothetical protein
MSRACSPRQWSWNSSTDSDGLRFTKQMSLITGWILSLNVLYSLAL